MSRSFQLLALTPAGTTDPAIAIAACRAGELGVLDLLYHANFPPSDAVSAGTRCRGAAVEAIAALERHARGPYGLKIHPDDTALIETIANDTPPSLRIVVLACGTPANLASAVAALKPRGLTVLAEVTDLDAARAALAAGGEGLIAKGHEAGGRVGEESTFVLLQHLLGALEAPIYAYGGIGLHSAAACYAAGAAGVVLDSQLALTRESALPEAIKEKIAVMDGSETATFGTRLGHAVRLYSRPGLAALDAVRREEIRLENDAQDDETRAAAWRAYVDARIGWAAPSECVYPLGQDAALAAALAEQYVTVAGVLAAIRSAIAAHCSAAATQRALDANAPLAQAHGTLYPVAQGPMTRVSDTAAFAKSVADGGALPFLALALLRSAEVRALLEQTKALLGERPWGVGILGFVSQELRDEQLKVVEEIRPPWALIAGGRPSQAYSLEQQGIPTYLHVPSPGLLKMFLHDGAHRFIFEGRECGGHVGPRTSFVLWEAMIAVLLEARRPAQAPPIDVLFAGGIHDARSAAMVATMAAPLVERGIRVGVLMGTAYLFTEEAVSGGAIMPVFQQEAIACTQTVLLESGPGHSTRCVNTPFVDLFQAERRRLLGEGVALEEVRAALEDLNVGRLRVASKGINRHPRYGQDPEAPKFVTLSDDEQRADGMYMIGQVAGLRNAVTTIAALHEDVCVGSAHVLEGMAAEGEAILDAPTGPTGPVDVAIVGLAAIMPKAPDVQTYWENILNKVNAITEVPPDRWDWRRYYDEDKNARDRVYSRWGGFLEDFPFEPLSYGMPPNSLRSIEPMQLLTLEAVRAALDDAGYARRPFPRERTAVMLGASGVSDLGLLYGVRSTLPSYLDGDGEGLVAALADTLPEWTEDSFAGVLMNVTAGRVTNRFDFGGTNFTVDAACASSLAAVSQGVQELQLGKADVVIAGGADTTQNAHAFMSFSKTQALSERGRCSPFDVAADGIAISEGAAIVVLKRLADAERDGDRIYAVIKGVGSSSDGRDKSLTAPRPEGQMRALRRAYAQAGYSPKTVGLIEAHGTGTVVGDKTEVASLADLFDEAGAAPGSCAIGSVKSMIGHTKAAAGVASLVKIALALHHRTLPATLVETPNPKAGFGENAFYVNSETRPWLTPAGGAPRRAGISGFGFGGTNFHVTLEEYGDGFVAEEPNARRWSSELFLFRGTSREALRAAVESVAAGLDRGARPALLDLAAGLARAAEAVLRGPGGAEALTLSIVAGSLEDLRAKLATAATELAGDAQGIHDPRGIYFSAQPLARDGAIAFLFPGQGSQYTNMLRDLATQFPAVRVVFEQADLALREQFPQGLGSYIFPTPTFSKEDAEKQQTHLTATNVAQPALGAAGVAMLTLLGACGVAPSMVAGHSYGELVALYAAGVYDLDALFRLSAARGRFMAEAAGADDPGTMAAVSADAATVAAVIAGIDGVVLANLNAPTQTVISGTKAGIEQAIGALKAAGLRAKALPVSCAFHSPLVAAARDRFAAVVAEVPFESPAVPVYANLTGGSYPGEAEAMRALLADQLISPVKFVDEIDAMYEAGARLFVEVGPKAVLSGLAGAILGDRPNACVATDQANRAGLLQLQHALGQMAAHGAPVSLEPLFQGRGATRIDPRAMDENTGRKALAPTTWLVNGGYARPLAEGRRSMAPVALTVAYDALRDVAPTEAATIAVGTPASSAKVAATAEGSVATKTEVQMANMQRDDGTGGLEPVAPAREGAYASNGHAHAAFNGNGTSAEHYAAAHYPVAAQAAPEPVWAPAAQGLEPATEAPMYVDEMSVAVMQFQQVMAQFLETQRAVMGAYFGQAPAPAAQPAPTAYNYLPPPAPAPAPLSYTAPTPAAPTYAAPTPAAAQPYAPPLTVPPYTPPPTYAVQPPATQPPAAPAPAPTPAPAAQAAAPAVTSAPTQDTPAPAAQSSAPAPAALDEAELTRRLLTIVGERTGYPTEMLDLDLDLEADLGIDSIKRVEIVGSLRRSVGATSIPDGAMEKLSAVKTLRAVVNGMLEVIAPHTPAHPPPASPAATVTAPDASHASVAAVPRFTLRTAAAPSTSQPHGIVSLEGTVVVTDDERGIAQAVASALRQQGHTAIVLRAAPKTEDLGQDLFATNFADPDALAEALSAIRGRHGPVGGVIHLLPLRGETPSRLEMDLPSWKQRIAEDVKGLYYLAHNVGPELLAPSVTSPALDAARPDAARPAKKGALLAVTGMGGAFGFDSATLGASSSDVSTLFPGHGGIAGFLKTLGLEWSGVQVKAIDVALREPAATLAAQILEELALPDDEMEIGRAGAARLVLEPVAMPFGPDAAATLSIEPSDVILVTGGARGITAGTAVELARHCPATLILAGRSPLPEPREASDTAGLREPKELKAALIARLRAAGELPAPAKVEAAYGRLLQDREMREAMAALHATGATVRYVTVDVRDEAAFGALIDDIYTSYGRLDGVIHGAGVIEDKLVLDKTPASFDRVFDTKADSGFVLARKLRPEALKFLAFFSSVTARFGNRGQADYGAANDVMNKLALELDARWPARVVAFNWGPWGAASTAGGGMVGAEIEAQFARRGIELIKPEVGNRRALEELLLGRKGEVEIVYGDGPWSRGMRRMVST